jgi:hypothetical protein
MKFRIQYRRARVTVTGTKKRRCEACGAIGRTEMHHYHYSYTTKEVRKDPQLAIENTIELCYLCHKMADMLRRQASDRLRTGMVCDALLKKIGGGRHGADIQ